jgi:quercetin 2,3-dioxygenase
MPPRHTLADPSLDIRPSSSRHRTTIAWLDGRHSFDTGIDPFGHDTHHGLLVVHNHDTIAPLGGFDTHPHRGMEIVTWVLSGTLVHQDSEGHNGAIYPNLAQRMSAGTDIWHSEKNDGRGATEPKAHPDSYRDAARRRRCGAAAAAAQGRYQRLRGARSEGFEPPTF